MGWGHGAQWQRPLWFHSIISCCEDGGWCQVGEGTRGGSHSSPERAPNPGPPAGRDIGLCNGELSAMSGQEVESMEPDALAGRVKEVGSLAARPAAGGDAWQPQRQGDSLTGQWLWGFSPWPAAPREEGPRPPLWHSPGTTWPSPHCRAAGGARATHVTHSSVLPFSGVCVLPDQPEAQAEDHQGAPGRGTVMPLCQSRGSRPHGSLGQPEWVVAQFCCPLGPRHGHRPCAPACCQLQL